MGFTEPRTADRVVTALLAENDAKSFLRKYLRTKTKLRWMLRNWRVIEGFAFEMAQTRQFNDGDLVVQVQRSEQRYTPFASLSVCWRFLDRPVFRGLPFTLIRANGESSQFTIGDAQWKALDRLDYTSFRQALAL